jgi:AraC family transcriptional regulator of adaptative response/methylated-DNA-[protein]-cysteine methyltransferase
MIRIESDRERCRPREAGQADPGIERVRIACRYIDEQPERRPTLAELGAEVGSSPYHLQRTFKRVLGLTPRQYADARRVERLKSRLRQGDGVAGALYGAGYGSSSRLYEKAPRQLGMTPAAYRRGASGERITYTIVRAALGRLLVATTARGICRVGLAETVAELEADLRQEFPGAVLERDDAALRSRVAGLVEYLAGKGAPPELPLDVRATAFQRRVWEELQSIPCGATASYDEIARRIGRPGAARAVAQACATNPVSLVIPCHRVVRKDGRMGGYRWGVERKQALLRLEAGLRKKARGQSRATPSRRSTMAPPSQEPTPSAT